MAQTWVKWHLEVLHDPKILRLSVAGRWAWAAMLPMAKANEPEGEVSTTASDFDGLATELDVGLGLRLDPAQRAGLSQDLEAMAGGRRPMLRPVWDEGRVVILNWEKRQARKPSDSREAMRERAKRHREKKKALASRHVTRDTVTRHAEERRGEEKRAEEKRSAAAAAAAGRDAPDGAAAAADEDPFVPRVLSLWADMPHSPGTRPCDRKTAESWARAGVPLPTVEAALSLLRARHDAKGQKLPRSLAYLKPLVDELLEEPDGYADYLLDRQRRLSDA